MVLIRLFSRGTNPTQGGTPPYYFFRSGRCVSAEPAALFAGADDFGFRSTLDAFEPAFLPVCSFFAMRITSFLSDLSQAGEAGRLRSGHFHMECAPVLELGLPSLEGMRSSGS